MASHSNSNSTHHSESSPQEQVEQPATAAVLNINELLHLTLGGLPLKHKVRLRRVSKTWKEVLFKVGYTVKPVKVVPAGRPAYMEEIPHYPADTYITINPAVQIYGTTCDTAHSYRCSIDSRRYIWESTVRYVPPHLHKGAQEYFTSPPITQVAIADRWTTTVLSVLRVPEGIRIIHLLDACRKVCTGPWLVKGSLRGDRIMDSLRSEAVFAGMRKPYRTIFKKDYEWRIPQITGVGGSKRDYFDDDDEEEYHRLQNETSDEDDYAIDSEAEESSGE